MKHHWVTQRGNIHNPMLNVRLGYRHDSTIYFLRPSQARELAADLLREADAAEGLDPEAD